MLPKCALFLLLEIAFVNSVYFSMVEIKLNLPGNKKRFPPGDRTVINLNALQEIQNHEKNNRQEHFRYSLKSADENFLQVFASTGDVMFTKKFFEDNKGTQNITTEGMAEDIFGEKATTNIQILVSPTSTLDCDLIVQDLCYFETATYRIYENQKATLIGTLSSQFLAEMCPKYKLNYTLIQGGNQFGLVPPTGIHKSWEIRTLIPLERDVVRSMQFLDNSANSGEIRNLSLICTVENEQGTIRDVPRDLWVQIIDQDDNAPIAQTKGKIDIEIHSNIIAKDQIVEHKDLIFIDRDSPPVNHYDIRVINDSLGILHPKCNIYEDDRQGESQTAIYCTLIFAKDMQMSSSPYMINLLINDTSLLPGFGNSSVEVPIHIHFLNRIDTPKPFGFTIPPTELRSPNLLYPNTEIKIFRTVAPFARVSQPLKHKIKEEIRNFHFRKEFLNKGFNITNSEGIIFVHNSAMIKNASFIRLQIEWTNDKLIQSDEIVINIIDEPTHTCDNIEVKNWKFCAENKTPKTCAKTCGISTGGFPSVEKRKSSGLERCMWRGDRNPGNNTTHLYSTCTPDIATCPDGICDSLEQLNDLICPQDCSKKLNFPMQANKRTGRGFEYGEGICSCNAFGDCFCEYLEPKNKKKKTKKITVTENTIDFNNVYVNSTSALYTNSSTYTAGDKEKCGTICILGIGGACLFLIAIVTGMVFRWKLNKKQKNGIRIDNGDLSLPLANYLDRNGLENFQLNFEMTSAFSHSVLRSQLQPDPKWEFPRSQLSIERTLGEGEFGRVLRAQALNIGGQTGMTTVAVKTLKDDAGERELADLLSEYELLKEVSHPNIIKLLGASTTPEGPIYLIIEFAELGSLRSYLRRSRHLQPESRMHNFRVANINQEHYDEPKICDVCPKDILSFAWQISNGMDYLTQIKLVHRDLAARNILLAKDKVCKISDFGLTRDVYEDEAYFKKTKGRLPVKWMAPESLSDHVYTTKSDVWSFGILLWELITLGSSPYPGVSLQSLFHLLKTGYRMERPENCSVELYKVMKSCWVIDPESRPTFALLSKKFEKMLNDEVQYLEFTSNSVYNRTYLFDDDEQLEEQESKIKVQSPVKNSLNYLENMKNYAKCGEIEKLLVVEKEGENITITKNEGYETPVKIKNCVEKPHNGYTDMKIAIEDN